MTPITLRVLDGADRGRVFAELPPPITIGREEGNTIQLNDERVSRYHLKIQEDHEKLVLTDLESTNGTRVNGEDIQLRILRFGDLISLGRSTLLFGSRDEIAARLANLPEDQGEAAAIKNRQQRAHSLDFEINRPESGDLQATLHAVQPPELPERLTPGQAAQLAELLEFIHIRIRQIVRSVGSEDQPEGRVTVEPRQWQNLLDLQAKLAEYLRNVGDPE